MPSFKFRIAGLIFETVLPFCVEIQENFFPFLEYTGYDKRQADCVAFFKEKERLLFPKGKIVAQNDALKVMMLSNGTWIRCFLESCDKRCLSLGRILLDGSVMVEFLPDARKYLSNTEHVFFHIAMEEQLLRHGRWIVHASCVKTPLGAVLFTGPSGMGKTTQAELWEKYRGSKVLNGDRTIIYQKDGVWYAAGSPYAGSSKRYVNESAPIALVALLEQGTDNRVQGLTPGQAFRGLYPHLTVNDWNPWYVETITNQLDQFVRERPVVHFSCTPDEKAVDALWEELTKEVDHG